MMWTPTRRSVRPLVNVAKLREDGWRIMRNPPSYRGHGHTEHAQAQLRTQPPPRCQNCD